MHASQPVPHGLILFLMPGASQLQSHSSSSPGDIIATSALLDKIFESICRPVRVRVEQVLMMSPPLLLCYQLGQLADFYNGLVNKLLGPAAALSVTLSSCRDMAQRTFFEQLRGAGDRLLRSPPQPPADLSPPPQVSDVAAEGTAAGNPYC